MRDELVLGDLVDPGADDLAEKLAAALAADRVGYGADCIGWVYEAKCHVSPKVKSVADGKTD